MAVRYSASGQHHSFTTSLPSSPFTIACWVLMFVDRDAVSAIWDIEGSGGANGLRTTSDGRTLQVLSGASNVVGPFVLSLNGWHKLAVSVTGTTATFYFGSSTSGLSSASGTYENQVSASTARIGSTAANDWFSGRIAAFKQYSAALSLEEVTNELACYVPIRTTNLTRWCPFVKVEATDYSGNGLNLSGGAGAPTQAGPPIPWRTRGNQQYIIPWDPTTTVWYAVYDTTTGELLSTGSVLPVGGLQSGQEYKEYITGQPDQSVYFWDTTARDFVLREGTVLKDRVADLLADGTLTSAWAALSAPDSTAMQTRVGQMLGPHRYRLPSQDIDLE